VAGVSRDQQHGRAVSQDLPGEPLSLPAHGHWDPGAAKSHPSQEPAHHWTEAGEEKRESVASQWESHSTDGQGARVTAGGAGDKISNGHPATPGCILIGNDHDPGRIGSPQCDSDNGVKDQSGCEIPSEEGKPKGGDSRGEHGPKVHPLGADPVRDAGENYQGDRIADLEPAGHGTSLSGRHSPFPPELKEGPRIGHEYQAVEYSRCAKPSKPTVESGPFLRIRNHGFSKESRNEKSEGRDKKKRLFSFSLPISRVL
jgi:hypothetical protein